MATKSPTTWIFVTDHKKAKILINEGPKTGLKQVLVEDAEARLRQDTKTVHKQKTTGWWIFGSQSAKAPAKRQALSGKNMIEDAASLLNRAGRRGHFDTLVLVGPQSMIKAIKAKLNETTVGRLHGELSKELANLDEDELERYLGNIILL